LKRFNDLGDMLQTGEPEIILAPGAQRQVAMIRQNGTDFCTGWRQSLEAAKVPEFTKKASALWAS
jgi:hypothetical protein